jgi:phage terminase large subunit-like protein
MTSWDDPIEDMDRYVDSVLNGDIVACRSVIGACKRHRTDLQRQDRDSFGYYFDEDHARNVCNFFPTIMRHSIGKNMGQPFVLQPWQSFAIASIYGWKSSKDKTRRFRKAYISVARKNGKSTLAAALCIYAAGYDFNPVSNSFESVAQVVLAASKKEQADRVTMAECIRMRQSSDVLKAASEYKNRQITFHHNDGHIITVGSDKAFDGLNPSIVQIDEMHAFRSSGNQKEFIDTMKTGSGARSQPLFLVTTTAGSTSSELWKSEWRYAIGVATGEYYDDSYFSLSYELDEDDDPLDSDLWIKANPCLGVTLTEEYLEDQAKPARVDSVALNRFTRYHGNRLVSNLDSAFSIDQWDKSEGELSDWSEADAIGAGCDLGGRDDLAAWAQVSRFETDDFTEDEDGNRTPIYRYEAIAKSYIARDTERDLDVAPFNGFVESGLLTVSRHPISELERDLVEACRNNGCYEVAFDPYNAQRTGERMEEEGMEGVTMPQSTRYFNEPIVELRSAIAEGRFKHNGDPLLRWAMGNAVLITDRNDRVMYAKNECEDKIDPCVALTMAFARAMAAPSKSNGYFTY